MTTADVETKRAGCFTAGNDCYRFLAAFFFEPLLAFFLVPLLAAARFVFFFFFFTGMCVANSVSLLSSPLLIVYLVESSRMTARHVNATAKQGAAVAGLPDPTVLPD